jgi:predicted aspartyl protease
MPSMGHVHVMVAVGRLDASNGHAAFRTSAEVKALADTDATYCTVPADVLRGAGIVPLPAPISPVRLTLADGREIRRPLAYAWLQVEGRVIQTPVLFGEPEDPVLLGVLAMELANLAVDPVTRQILKRDAFPQY